MADRTLRRNAIVASALIFTALAVGPLFASRPAQTRMIHVGDQIEIGTPTSGDVEMMGGILRIDALLKGDVVVLGTDVRFGDQGRVDGNLYVLGGTLQHAKADSVTGKTVAALGTRIRTTGPMTGDDTIRLGTVELQVGLALLWLILASILAVSVPRAVRVASVEARTSAAYLFFLGLVGVTSLAVTALVASWALGTGLGEVVLIATAVAGFSAKIFGMVAVFHAAGSAIAGPKTHSAARSSIFRGDLARTVIGLAILTVIRLIPVVGNVVWITLSIIGIGAAFGTMFGRREPAFLAVQTVPVIAGSDRDV